MYLIIVTSPDLTAQHVRHDGDDDCLTLSISVSHTDRHRDRDTLRDRKVQPHRDRETDARREKSSNTMITNGSSIA